MFSNNNILEAKKHSYFRYKTTTISINHVIISYSMRMFGFAYITPKRGEGEKYIFYQLWVIFSFLNYSLNHTAKKTPQITYMKIWEKIQQQQNSLKPALRLHIYVSNGYWFIFWRNITCISKILSTSHLLKTND